MGVRGCLVLPVLPLLPLATPLLPLATSCYPLLAGKHCFLVLDRAMIGGVKIRKFPPGGVGAFAPGHSGPPQIHLRRARSACARAKNEPKSTQVSLVSHSEPPRVAKSCQELPHGSPRANQEPPRATQELPRATQESPRAAPRAAESDPDCQNPAPAHTRSTFLQNALVARQEPPRARQEPPQSHPRAAKSDPRAAQ